MDSIREMCKELEGREESIRQKIAWLQSLLRETQAKKRQLISTASWLKGPWQ